MLLIEEKDNFEYFCHKYRVSNNLKSFLNLITKNYNKNKEEKNFLKKNLKKNIYKYGKKNIKFKKVDKDFETKLKLLNRQALHAKSLGFIHPTSKKFISFDSKIPNDYKKLLDLLNKLSD